MIYIKKIVTSIWVLALLIAVPAVLLAPSVLKKYDVRLKTEMGKRVAGSTCYFNDLNNDGAPERVEAFRQTQNGTSLFSFQVFENQDLLKDQYNFLHRFDQRLLNLFFCDINNNGLTEVFGFTLFGDSIFLNWIEPYGKDTKCHTKFMFTFDKSVYKTPDVSIKDIHWYDLDNDGNNELLFSSTVGFNLKPRKLFVYHPETDSLQESEDLGIHFRNLVENDFNNDGQPELFAVGSSAFNYNKSNQLKYLDDRPRFFVFDKNLKPIIEPIEFPPGVGSKTFQWFINKSELLVLYYNHTTQNTGIFITRTNPINPVAADTIRLPVSIGKTPYFYRSDKNRFVAVGNHGKIYWVNTIPRIIDSLDLHFTNEKSVFASYDFFGDGTSECVFLDETSYEFSIYFEDFKYKVSIEKEYSNNLFLTRGINNEFIVQTNNNLFFYEIIKHRFYWLSYFLHLLYYLLAVIIIWIIQLVTERRVREKYELRNQVIELQLQSLSNQLDPHFIFNTFNTISSIIKQGRNDDAYNLMVRFSKLVRKKLDNSNNIYASLKNEIEFAKDYLSIQKMRFPSLFDYIINVDKGVDTSIEIPRLLLQIHIENSLKHGIRPMLKGGLVNIHVYSADKNIVIDITDNGIGREKSKEKNKTSSKIGLQTMTKIIEINNQNKSNKIAQEIIDLIDPDGKTAGTKIVLTISKA